MKINQIRLELCKKNKIILIFLNLLKNWDIYVKDSKIQF
jgi:hypothetical protein